ncbi:MAG: hypothetical protein DSY42_05310 [Aquifex sp.]|nr:MAG: hypothetical protein DSY42_05310 [Aquifex sp.]
MATGNFQLTIADCSSMSQPSVYKYVSLVSRAIASLAPEVIKFPQPAEEQTAMEKLGMIGGMPGVIGCIDTFLLLV